MKRYVYIVLIMVMCSVQAWGAAVEQDSDSLTPRRENFVQRIINYFTEDSVDMAANVNKKFRFSLLGGPNYASDMKFGIGVAGVMQYRLNGCEAPMQPSTATIAANVTTAKFWSLSMIGTTFFPDNSKRINTDISLSYSPRDFWGLRYENGDNDIKTKLHQIEIKIKGEMLWRLLPNYYVGPTIEFDFSRSGEIDLPELLEGQDHVVRNYGAGFSMQYDTRDLTTNASRGIYLYWCQLFRPKFLWNHYAFTTTDFRACYYHKAWAGAIIAGEYRALFNFGHPSWAMMSLLGDTRTMRGYYKGRYRDNHMMTAQVEVRQRIYKRIGATVWGGAGTVFHDSHSFCNKVLPNYGVGFRWEFRDRVNVRLDYGFGKAGQSGFMFSINEAF